VLGSGALMPGWVGPVVEMQRLKEGSRASSRLRSGALRYGAHLSLNASTRKNLFHNARR